MGDRERHPLGLPERDREGIPVGAVPWGSVEWRVSVHDGEHGHRVDIREYVLPRRAEATRAYVPKGKGRGRVPREPFVGYTKTGLRIDVDATRNLIQLLTLAADAAEELDQEEAIA
ncbi:MAG TPA: hypothetical protein VFQ40_02510 [Actinomycetota bacterium]|nr:hypothetical protein [Actinomycetota bacterium]